MILEKDRIYKVKHIDVDNFQENFPRDYVIISPKSTYDVSGYTKLPISKTMNIFCTFIVCFTSQVKLNGCTSLDEYCEVSKITERDYDDIKKALSILDPTHNTKYNRKLKKIIYESNK